MAILHVLGGGGYLEYSKIPLFESFWKRNIRRPLLFQGSQTWEANGRGTRGHRYLSRFNMFFLIDNMLLSGAQIFESF